MKNRDLQQLFVEYTKECEFSKKLRPDTIRGYREAFRHFKNLMPEIRYPSDLNKSMIVEFFRRMQVRKRTVGKDTERAGVRASTIRTYGSKLHSFFDWLYREKLIETNPVDKKDLPKVSYEDHRALEKGEINKIITAITMHSKNSLMMKRDLVMVNILFGCGLRRGELMGLQVRDINMEKRLLTVRPETSKSKHIRILPINPALHLHLDEYLKERTHHKTEYLIISTTKDARFTLHGLKHWVNRLEYLSGVKFHLHRFRHTFACSLANNNVNAIKIQKALGHADPRMTAVYLRSMGPEDLREDMNRVTLDNL